VLTRFTLMALLAVVCADHLLYRQNVGSKNAADPGAWENFPLTPEALRGREAQPDPYRGLPLPPEKAKGGLDIPAPDMPRETPALSWPCRAYDSCNQGEGQIILQVRYDRTRDLEDAFNLEQPPCWSRIDENYRPVAFRGIEDSDGSLGFLFPPLQWPNFANMLESKSSVLKWTPTADRWLPPSLCSIPAKIGTMTVSITSIEMHINGQTHTEGSLQLLIAKKLVPSESPTVGSQTLGEAPSLTELPGIPD
jgi:hypothetical protein